MPLFSKQQVSSLRRKRPGLSDPPMRSPCWSPTKGRCLARLKSAAVNSHTQCPEHSCPCLLSHLSWGESHSWVAPDIEIFSIIASHCSFPQTYYTQVQLLPHTCIRCIPAIWVGLWWFHSSNSCCCCCCYRSQRGRGGIARCIGSAWLQEGHNHLQVDHP